MKYIQIVQDQPKLMRVLLRNYFYFPLDIRELLLDEYSAWQNIHLFNGRIPRPDADISMELKLNRSELKKMHEIHESDLFELINKSCQEV